MHETTYDFVVTSSTNFFPSILCLNYIIFLFFTKKTAVFFSFILETNKDLNLKYLCFIPMEH